MLKEVQNHNADIEQYIYLYPYKATRKLENQKGKRRKKPSKQGK
jgi:hypothetical protein